MWLVFIHAFICSEDCAYQQMISILITQICLKCINCKTETMRYFIDGFARDLCGFCNRQPSENIC